MPPDVLTFDQNQAYTLRLYVDQLRMWVQSWLLQPVTSALGGLVPKELGELHAALLEIVNGLGSTFSVEHRFLPLVKRALLEQKRVISERQEDLRQRTPAQGRPLQDGTRRSG